MADARLRSFIERLERLEADKADIAADIRQVKAEAKGAGYDVKVINEVLKQRRMDAAARNEFLELVDAYKHALGMLSDTPLGQAAVDAAKKDTKKGATGKTKPAAKSDPAKPDNKAAPAKPDNKAMAPKPETIAAAAIGPEWAADDDAKAADRGAKAHAAGKPITANPYPPKDKRRPVWDRAWRAADGSDGMDIPKGLKPASPKPDPKAPAQPADPKGSDPKPGQPPADSPPPPPPPPSAPPAGA